MKMLQQYGSFIERLRNQAELIRLMDAEANKNGMRQTNEATAKQLDRAANILQLLATELDIKAMGMNMICDGLGGLVEGHPPTELNLLQRINELVAKEAK